MHHKHETQYWDYGKGDSGEFRDTLEEALDNINEAITGCLKSRLIIAKENYLKKAISVQNKFRISLDTKMAAEYA